MVNQIKTILLSILLIFSVSCFNQKFSIEDNLKKKYDKGISLFEKGKYTRAREQFDFIVMNSPGSFIAIDAQSSASNLKARTSARGAKAHWS